MMQLYPVAVYADGHDEAGVGAVRQANHAAAGRTATRWLQHVSTATCSRRQPARRWEPGQVRRRVCALQQCLADVYSCVVKIHVGAPCTA
jgi:hypothetical protein